MSELKTNKISPAVGTGVTLGDDGDTFTIPAGVTITNSGTVNGFGGVVGSHSFSAVGSYPATSTYGSSASHDTTYTPVLSASTIFIFYSYNVRGSGASRGLCIQPIFGSETVSPADVDPAEYNVDAGTLHHQGSLVASVAWSGTPASQAVKLQSKYYSSAGCSIDGIQIIILEVA